MSPSTPLHPGVRRGLALGIAVALGAAAPLRAQVPDPFQPHTRWAHTPAAGAAWLPRDVALADGGNLVWAAGSLDSPRLMLLSGTALQAAGVSLAPLELEPLPGGSGAGTLFGHARVVAGARPDTLVAALQLRAPDEQHLRTLVQGFDPLAAAVAGGFGPLWTHDPGWLVGGGVLLAGDAAGERVALALRDASTGLVRVDRLDALDGALLSSASLPAGSLRALCMSADASLVALVAGARLLLLDAAGAVLLDLPLAQATRALAVDADGTHIAVGAGDTVRLLARQGTGWVDAGVVGGAPGEVATRLALADDGQTLAVGWWNGASGLDVRFELLAGTPLVRVLDVWQHGGSQGQQNFPAAVEITPDGRRAAFGAWGAGDAQPELLLVDRDLGAAVLLVDLPGSVEDLALDPSGTRVAVALKHGHANTPASSGELRLLDTGERDLQVLGSPANGASLHLAARTPGAGWTWFLLGPRLATPIAYPGATGLLAVDRAQALGLFAAQADPSGRADVDIHVPAGASFVGLEFAAQAIARVNGVLTFSNVVVDPLVL